MACERVKPTKVTHKIATRFDLRRSYEVKYILKQRQVVYVILNSVKCSFSSFLLNMIQFILHFPFFLLELVESRLFYYYFTGDACSDTSFIYIYIYIYIYIVRLLLLV